MSSGGGQLIDYFVVCGLEESSLQVEPSAGYVGNVPPLHRPYTGAVISHYPINRSWNPFDGGAIKTQCMPEGIKLSKNTPSFQQQYSFHSLIITRENGTHQYGSVLMYNEPVRSPVLLDTLESHQNEYQSKHRMDLSPTDQYWYFNRSTDTLYATKCLCLVTSLPIFRPCQLYLEQLYEISVGKTRPSLPIESYLYNVLYETHLPRPGRALHLHGPTESIVWRLPGKDELPLCDYSFKSLFESVSLKNVLQLFTCVLLEQQILLKANDFHQLMLCASCMTALLFPYSWPHVFVPILPSSQHGFLDAPVPFIMGLRMNTDSNTNDLDILNKASLSLFDMDRDTLETPEDLPLLPDYDKLYSRLADVITQYDVACPDSVSTRTSTSPSSKDDKKHSIIDALRLVKSMSESPRQSPKPMLVGGSIGHCSSLPKGLDNPLVKELQSIMSRSSIGGKEEGSPTRVSPTTGVLDHEDETVDISSTSTDSELDFSNAVRTIFCNYFVEHFATYENFVIVPNQTYAQWLRNREQFENFDKTAFLSDQPVSSRTFYSAFLETAMFATFIDSKLIATWDPSASDNSLLLFDKYIENHRQSRGILTTPSAGTTPSESQDSESGRWFDVTPKPHPLNKQKNGTPASDSLHEEGLFPTLDSALLTQCDETDTQTKTGNEAPLLDHNPSRPALKKSDTSQGSLGTTAYHSKFVLQLWRESRLRVKHMLGSSPEAQNNIEENTHIANLCDLLERIWGHGLRKRESKSPLWAHLMAFGETLCHEDQPSAPPPPPQTDPRPVTPDPYSHHSLIRKNYEGQQQHPKIAMLSHISLDESSSTPPPKRSSTPSLFRRRFQSPELKSLVEAILQPPPSPFLDDLKIISNMKEIKTDVGHARAWVRLCLEKKSLSRHLSYLLSNTNLCRQRYRNYAFLLTEDEKEQFLLHLLSLSAGDFSCFTTAFNDTTMSYRVLVVSEGKYLGISTTRLFVNVGGERGESGVVPVPRGSYQVEFTCRNLGALTCIRLSHDNSGLVRSLLVEMVLVYCITTGQTYRFYCGRYFARAEDDGSIDRFIIGERISRKLKGSANISALGVDDVLPTTGGTKWNRSPKKGTGDDLMLSDIKGSLMSCVSKMIAVYENSSKESQRGKMLPLLYGPKGFVKSIENVFQLGYKCTRKFQKSLFIWDLIERVSLGTPTQQTSDDEADESSNGGYVQSLEVEPAVWQTFLAVVSQIDTIAGIGKDEKAMLFFLLGLRDHYLFDWIQVIANSASAQAMYEPVSFLRDPELLSFLLNCVKLTHSLSLSLEPLLVQGL